MDERLYVLEWAAIVLIFLLIVLNMIVNIFIFKHILHEEHAEKLLETMATTGRRIKLWII